MRAQDRPDGEVVVDVDAPANGYVFFSEPFYRQRRAYVDGARADVRKAKSRLRQFRSAPVTIVLNCAMCRPSSTPDPE